MKNKYVSRLVGLFFVLALISTTCGWIPFTAPFTIHSVPEGAAVYKTGGTTPVGTTPYKSHIFHLERTYEVRMDGFFNEPVLVDYNAAKDIYVKLRALPVLLYTKPDADVYAAGSDTPLGNTPLEMDVYHEDRTYTLKAKDYYDKEITIGLATETPMVLELERRPIISLTTVPEGTEIYENDALCATSTMTEEILTNRTFELRKEGYFKKTVELTSSSPYEMTVELIPLPVISIQSVPDGATVYLVGDDKPLGNAPLSLTIEKATRFEVRADRYYPETFTVEPKTQTAKAMLNAMPYVTITSDPAGAEVYLAGKLLGTTPLEQLIEKETAYEIRQEGYLPQTVTLTGKDAQPVITLETVPVVAEEVEAVVEAPVAAEEEAEKAPAQPGMNLPLIGGIAAAVVAALLFFVLKKKKTA
ncbi:MAG: PEGA domain-containing protein [Verrucomicrobia bacterium]|nr:PEGA domain-containing protein [Verrucomicrobiota bacterium]